MNGLIYLEPEDVLEIHDAYIDMFGGIKGIRDEGLFSQLCEAPYQEFDGVELFPTVFDKAAKYLEGFSRHQVFLDGNKRTAAGTMMIFLRANSIHVVFSKLELSDLTLAVANDEISFDDIVQSIKKHSVNG
ncbi:MAG: type II toxin-antitoxin system death-on-curing family toxin [Lachnospiraceae bacterium]|nr:type II toxin-antitoxin system death-on-curing family toxin [Lachnospiraceae bacterium]MDY3991448.1 type II toxin-antitoxin system death-on-curing family toxin [Lachnospiraceae bacterium]